MAKAVEDVVHRGEKKKKSDGEEETSTVQTVAEVEGGVHPMYAKEKR